MWGSFGLQLFGVRLVGEQPIWVPAHSLSPVRGMRGGCQKGTSQPVPLQIYQEPRMTSIF